jgi:energy-coupling factor transporter ATP-binding protein EcfA2
MLESITISFTDSPTIVLPAEGITVFVGSNNSGKSLILREVELAMSVHPFPAGLRIVQDYEVRWQSRESIYKFIEAARGEPNPNLGQGNVPIARINPNGGTETSNIHLESLYSITESKSDKRWYTTQFLKYGVIRLDGRSRFNLTNDQDAGDILKPSSNLIGKLFRDDHTRLVARSYVKDAFGFNLVVDPSALGRLRFRLSSEQALDDEQSLNGDARSFHSRATYIKDASDGVQAYVGIITAVVSGEFHTTLIDEPEAFLHPPLARKLGRQLAQLSDSRNGTLMASTHSADFLMGCVQGSSSVRVVRLEYQNGRSKGRLVDAAMLRTLFQNPLMRSSNATSALFYDGVVVTESDNDRAFYAEIYHRLVEETPDLPALLFINAQNKQTIKDIVGPLRQFGVPAAAITDIDIIKDGGSTWTQWLSAAQVPNPLIPGYQSQRQSVFNEFVKSGKDMKRDGGTEVLEHTARNAANHFFDDLNAYGIFPVRLGELEGWLKQLDVPGSKTKWAIAMLERLGSEPSSEGYVRPSAGDVWSFLLGVIQWVKNPSRKGT